MAETIQARVFQKADTLANWNANTLILGKGEQAFVISSIDGAPITFKIGNGSLAFSALPWPDFSLRAKVAPIASFTGMPTGLYLPTADGSYGGVSVTLATGYTVLYWDGTTVTKVVYPQDLSGYATITALNAKVGATDVFEVGINMVNKTAAGVELGKILNASAVGTTTNAGYNTTDFIPVVPGTIYTASTLGRLNFYDSAKAFLSTLGATTPLSTVFYSFTPPTGAVYVRESFTTANWATAQIQLGTVNRPYEDYNFTTYKAANMPASVRDVIYNMNNLYPYMDFGNKAVNGDYQNGLNGHRYLTTSLFVAPYALDTQDSPLGVGSKVVNFSNIKRSSDGKASLSRDVVSVPVPPELLGTAFTMSFSCYFKGDRTFVVPAINVELYGSSYYLNQTSGVAVIDAITGTYSDWVKVNFYNVPITAQTTYVDFGMRLTTQGTAVVDTVYTTYHTGMAAEVRPDRAIFEKSVLDKVLAKPAFNIQNFVYGNLYNKRWTSFGDSITQYGYYQPYLVSKFGLIHTNRGIPGTTVTENGSIAWLDANNNYVDRPPATQPVGTTQISSSFCNQQRIDTIPSDSQLITILGGTNDSLTGLTIGAITDTVATTFYGAYQIMLNKMYARCPTAEIVLMIFTHIKDESTNTHGGVSYAEDYRNAIRAIGKKYKYRVIEVGSECGINQINNATYSADGVHPIPPTSGGTGYQRMAQIMIKGFQQIFPTA